MCLTTSSSSSEVHSYDPGIKPFSADGTVWITDPCVISPDNIITNFSDGTATFQFNNIDLFDWTTLANSLTDGALVSGTPTKATMSATVQWRDVIRRFNVDDTTNGFSGNFVETKATFKVSTQNADGFSFSSGESTTVSSRPQINVTYTTP